MRALIRFAALGTAVALMSLGAVASATDQPRQTIDPDGGANLTNVGLADDGTATAVWTSRGELRYAMRNANGRFGVPVPIPGAGLVSSLAYAESSNGNAIVAWHDLSADGDVRAAVRVGDGGFGPGEIVSGPMGNNNPTSVNVAINDSGQAVVVWHQFGADPGSINAALFDGSSFSGPATLITDSAVLNPVVGIDGTGRALAVWDYDTQSDDRIQGAAAPAGGGQFGAPFTIEQMQAGAGTPDLAVNESGDAVLAYEDGIPSSECTSSCSFFRVETRYGSVDGTFGAQQPTPLNNESGYAPGNHEVAIDDSGKAAVLMSMSSPVGRVLARTSDQAGTFGALQTVSPADHTSGPGLGSTNMDIDAGGGEFTAVFVNDHVGDGDENEVYQASTTNGTFGEVHQLSPTDDDSAQRATVGRNASGQTIAGWEIFIDDLVPQATPVGTGPALTEGSSGADDLTGTSVTDVVFLNEGNDRFNGGGGNDEINGGAGADNLNGGGGKDQLKGDGGNDKLIGAAGFDAMNGGAGRDTCSGTLREKRKAKSCEKWVKTSS